MTLKVLSFTKIRLKGGQAVHLALSGVFIVSLGLVICAMFAVVHNPYQFGCY